MSVALAPSLARTRAPFPRWAWSWGLIAGLAFLGGMLAPYALSITVMLWLGIAHNVQELRYLALKWGDSPLVRRSGWALLGLVGVVSLLRFASTAGWIASDVTRTIEIMAMYALVAVALWGLRPGTPSTLRWSAGTPAGIGLALAAVLSLSFPQWHFLVFTHLHNFVPLLFLRQALKSPAYPIFDLCAVITMLTLPAIVLLGYQPPTFEEASRLSFGLPMGHTMTSGYFLREWAGTLWPHRLLALFAYTQALHFGLWVAVIPTLLPPTDQLPATIRPLIVPSAWIVLTIALFGVVAFASNYSVTSQWYPVLAAWHAYLELPLVLLALQTGPDGASSGTDRLK